jgi:hypothetical protein
MSKRTKIERFTVTCNSFLQILHLSQLLKAGTNIDSEVIQGFRTIRMAGRPSIERLAFIYDGDLQILQTS